MAEFLTVLDLRQEGSCIPAAAAGDFSGVLTAVSANIFC